MLGCKGITSAINIITALSAYRPKLLSNFNVEDLPGYLPIINYIRMEVRSIEVPTDVKRMLISIREEWISERPKLEKRPGSNG